MKRYDLEWGTFTRDSGMVEAPEGEWVEYEAVEALLRDLVDIARGAREDYLGGYADPRELEIYRHGMQTVLNSITARRDSQTNVLLAIGRKAREEGR